MTTKQILDSQGYGIVKFDATGSVSKRCDECSNKTRKIARSIQNSLGLNKGLIEIQRPREIPHGLQLTLNIHLNHIQSRDIDYKKELNDLYQNGELAEILKTSWDLQIAPRISSFEFKVQESKNRQRGAVEIKLNGNNHHELPQNEDLFPPQPTINISDNDDTDSSSTDIIDTNGMLTIGGKGEIYIEKENQEGRDRKEMNRLDDKLESEIELHKIARANKQEEEGKDADLETIGLKQMYERQKSTAL